VPDRIRCPEIFVKIIVIKHLSQLEVKDMPTTEKCDDPLPEVDPYSQDVCNKNLKPSAEELDESYKKSLLTFPDTLLIVFLLFPGFLAERVAEYFSSAPELKDFQLVAAAFGGTLAIVSFTWAITYSFHKSFGWRGLSLQQLAIRPSFIVANAFISIVAGVAWAYVDSHGLIFRLGITERVSRRNAWEVAFVENARRVSPMYVRVETESGEVYHGYQAFFSQGMEDRSLLLKFARKEKRQISAKKQDESPNIITLLSPRDCTYVGTDKEGQVLILKEQIKNVEFRPAAFGPKSNEYSCEEWRPTEPLKELSKTHRAD
jgi:hypothetical protein